MGRRDYETRKVHQLGTWSPYFMEMVNGRKTFDVRQADRDFQKGDVLELYETIRETGKPTGRRAWFRVVYLMDDSSGFIKEGTVVMGVERINTGFNMIHPSRRVIEVGP